MRVYHWAKDEQVRETGVILQPPSQSKNLAVPYLVRNNPIVGLLLILNSISVSKLWPFLMVRGCTVFCIQGLPGLRDKQVLSWSATSGLPADHKTAWQWQGAQTLPPTLGRVPPASLHLSFLIHKMGLTVPTVEVSLWRLSGFIAIECLKQRLANSKHSISACWKSNNSRKGGYSSKLRHKEKNEGLITNLERASSFKERWNVFCLVTAPRKLVKQKNWKEKCKRQNKQCLR